MIGITGGVACGKSTILSCLRNAGYSVFSCDEAAHKLFGCDSVQAFLQLYREKLRVAHPERVISDVGALPSRFEVGGWMFADPAFKLEYEQLLVPQIISEMMASGSQFSEVPTLFEHNSAHLFSKIWVVAIDAKEQFERLLKRLDGNEQRANEFLNAQWPLSEKITLADRVIWTNRPMEEIDKEVLLAAEQDLL